MTQFLRRLISTPIRCRKVRYGTVCVQQSYPTIFLFQLKTTASLRELAVPYDDLIRGPECNLRSLLNEPVLKYVYYARTDALFASFLLLVSEFRSLLHDEI
jgi:hypothetical protein